MGDVSKSDEIIDTVLVSVNLFFVIDRKNLLPFIFWGFDQDEIIFGDAENGTLATGAQNVVQFINVAVNIRYRFNHC